MKRIESNASKCGVYSDFKEARQAVDSPGFLEKEIFQSILNTTCGDICVSV
jgi:hypothetical protein